MINLELPRKLRASANQAHQVAAQIMRPVSRKYDLAEHAYPVELDTMAAMIEGMSDAGGEIGGAKGGREASSDAPKPSKTANANGGNMSALVNVIETCWGDVGLTLSIPYQGLGNSAIAAVATDEQLERFGKVWASMAITEPSFGSDSAAVSTTAVLDGDEWVLNGEKIYVTAGERSTHIVVWATVDKSKGR
ncbi:MAG: acyl-CoA dehydrogenase family protein, partial [Rhodococcus sp. (in: high G+C Gram-positive bacteria)]